MTVTVIIPSYNGRALLEVCLPSVERQTLPAGEVIVVDNGSTDDTVCGLRRRWPGVRVMALARNEGFAHAVNVGVRAAAGTHVFLLNNDVELHPDCLRHATAALAGDARAFAVQAKMLRYHERHLLDDIGDEYTLFGWAYQDGHGLPDTGGPAVREVFSVCAGAALYDKAVLEELGGFDERYFGYIEDVDVGFRARNRGRRSLSCAAAVAYHVGSATTGGRHNDFKIRLSARNNVWTQWKNLPLPQLVLNAPLFLLGYGVKLAFFTARGFGRAYLGGLWEAFRALRRIERARFHPRLARHYLAVEGLMARNTLRYVGYQFRRRFTRPAPQPR